MNNKGKYRLAYIMATRLLPFLFILCFGVMEWISYLSKDKANTTLAASFHRVSALLSSNGWLGLALGIGILAFIASALFAMLYGPAGSRIPGTYIWVIKDTSYKIRDASVKDLYEYRRGSGAWKRKISRTKVLVWMVGFAAACILPLLLLHATGLAAVLVSAVVYLIYASATFVLQAVFVSSGSLMPGRADAQALLEGLLLTVLLPICAVYQLLFFFFHDNWPLWTNTLNIWTEWVLFVVLVLTAVLNILTFAIAPFSRE